MNLQFHYAFGERASISSTGVSNARIVNREEMLVQSSSTTPALPPVSRIPPSRYNRWSALAPPLAAVRLIHFPAKGDAGQSSLFSPLVHLGSAQVVAVNYLMLLDTLLLVEGMHNPG